MLVFPPTSIWDEDHMKNGFFSDVYRLTTAGSSSASVNGLRAFTGRSISIFRSTVNSRVVRVELQRHSRSRDGDCFHSAAWFQIEVDGHVGARLHQNVLMDLTENPCNSEDTV